MLTVLLAVAAVLIGVPMLSTAAVIVAATVSVIRDRRRGARPVAGHVLSTGRVSDSRGRVAFWGTCECDPTSRWYGAGLPLVWDLHSQHLSTVRALSAARHPSRGGAA